ncbi:MAG: phosphoglycerate kinase [Bacteroidota bacterium]
MMYQIDEVSFANKRVLVRVDFNVPLDAQFQVTDDTRIKAAIPTIQKLVNDGAKVVIMSHLGRPKSGPEAAFSLQHVIPSLKQYLKCEVNFVDDCIGTKVQQAVDVMPFGSVLILENLRFYKEEEKGDEFFAGQIAENGDAYVNDAFGTAHRAHASTAIIARFFPTDKYFGYLMENEVQAIDKVLHSQEKPVVAIVGGSKVSSKIGIIENLIQKVDALIIGGGMAFTFVKAKGGKVGSSLVEEDRLDQAIALLKLAEEKGVKMLLPVDAIVADKFAADAKTQVCAIDQIPEGWMGLDIAELSISIFRETIENAKIVLWNGPMGVFEMEAFAGGTKCIAQSLVTATQKGAFTLVGGGDSVAAINQMGMANDVSYVSTGGGAMLESLEGIVLPGIAAIRDNR